MSRCELSVYSNTGHQVGGGAVQLPGHPAQGTLDGIHREHIEPQACSYAAIRDGRTIRALYLSAPFVPRTAVRIGGSPRSTGRWLTSALQLGSPGLGRAWVGPELFLRQVDLGGSRAWLVTVLMHLHAEVEVRERTYERWPLYEWEQGGSRFYYSAKGASFSLYGGGNTPAERVEAVVREENPSSARSFLWSVGAVPLG